MSERLTVGDFSRATQLTIKTLRHYHEIGLLDPASVDPQTSYRYYSAQQIPQAQVIRRLRDLDMPVAEVKAVLAATDAADRSALINKHLERLETELVRTRAAVESLRAILMRPSYAVTHKTVPATSAIAIRATLDRGELLAWWHGAIGELHATARAQRLAGTLGGLYDTALFSEARGEAIVFVPLAPSAKPQLAGRIEPFEVPAAELALVTHAGSHDGIDAAYGELGAYVAAHEIAVDGPLREYYVRDPIDARDPADWLTEIAWPVFRSR
ncbi:MAG TPA: MerR family transcriptional regulator [Kofleriaceae bacterium]|jgi:DNA-binding transcriptional MerR regulator|nr:MerR family transcriptional regulator [Kofleriaceae bacterium]